MRDFLTNVFEAVLQNFTLPGLNGKYTAIIEYYFLVVSFRKCFLNEIKNTSNRVSYLQTIEPNTSILFLI